MDKPFLQVKDIRQNVKKHSPADSNYEKKASTNGKYFFNLKASNSQVIETSEMYESESGKTTGIDSVKKNAPAAMVDDQTA